MGFPASPRGLLSYFLTLHVLRLGSAEFRVVGPDRPLLATVGQDVVLPCHLSPRADARSLEIRWIRHQFSETVHLYRNGEDLDWAQMREYAGRTELVRDGLSGGTLDLRLAGVRPSDDGQYICTVRDAASYEEAMVELEVAAMGSVPLLSLEAHQDGGIRVVCGSAGWYPQPQVLWKAANGQRLPSVSQRRSSDERGLFEIQDVVVVSGKGDGNLSCVVRNSRLEQEQASSLHISAPFFHNARHWMAALGVFLVLSVASFGVITYLWRRKGKRDAELGESPGALSWLGVLSRVLSARPCPPEQPWDEKLSPLITHCSFFSFPDEKTAALVSMISSWLHLLSRVLSARPFPAVSIPSIPSIPWIRANPQGTCPGRWAAGGHRPRDGPSPLPRVPGDRPWDVTLLLSLLVAWRKFLLPENQDVVTLDPNTAHSQLVLSADQRRVRWQSEERDLPDVPERFTYWFCVLGQERFQEGRHCWEVEVKGEVGGKSRWGVGVARESVERKGRPFLSPDGGIWAVRHKGGRFVSLTSRRTFLPRFLLPSRICVCLDCARGLVTFLDADTGVEIFTFPPASFKGETLRPWFWVGTEKTQLCLRGSTS
ncbi:butyrophilin subfamily 1 member A1-like [Rissa tridactyla]|uniref:butyrophilin subfamily 1 member A1-like n=1 Tax=Rissa tridactyla TaxID=75485 RepID=UPI0023BA9350|nr:butyrophilin subfamily 1 member A1-like [Rissa tridactyla]